MSLAVGLRCAAHAAHAGARSRARDTCDAGRTLTPIEGIVPVVGSGISSSLPA